MYVPASERTNKIERIDNPIKRLSIVFVACAPYIYLHSSIRLTEGNPRLGRRMSANGVRALQKFSELLLNRV